MSLPGPFRFGLVLCGLLPPATALGQGVSIDHRAVGCVVAGKFPRFDARLRPADSVARARLHFRPEGGSLWYFVDMKPEAGFFRGILPKPKESLHRFSYYIDVTNKDFQESRTAEFIPDVVSGPAACARDRIVAAGLANANVVVHAPEGVAGAPAVPAGFAAAGVLSAGIAVAPIGMAATGGGLGPTALILGGVAVAGGTAAVLATSGGESSSRAAGAYVLATLDGMPLPVIVVETPCIGFADSGTLTLDANRSSYVMTETTRFQCLNGPGPINPHSETGRWSETGGVIRFTATGASIFNLSTGTLSGTSLTLAMDLLSDAVGIPPRRMTATWRKQ